MLVAIALVLLRQSRIWMGGETIMNAEGKTLKQKALHEFKEFIWISLYLFVFFWMFLEYKSIILQEQGIGYVAHGVALINALVLGKFMLIARALRPGHRADNAPLIYPTLLKSAIFWDLFGCLQNSGG